LFSCNTPKFDLVSIRPIYGWVDGCTEVHVGGAAFADDAVFKVGATEVPIEGRPTEDIDKGYWFTARTPAAAGKGYADISVTQNGETLTIPEAYYYVECPAPGYIEAASPSDVASGAPVTLSGCGFDILGMRVRLVQSGVKKPLESAVLPITTVCGSASVSFVAPDLPAGTYDVLITDPTGDTLIYPADYGCVPDSATACLPVTSVSYGGGS
jgi:hypothetical protein